MAGAAALACTYLAALADVVIVSRQDQQRPADAIVVLGAAQYNGHPSPVLKARLDHALDLYRNRLATIMVVTGGIGTGDRISEATAARRYLVAAGIPADSVVLEAGRSTAASMEFVADYLHGRGLSRVLLVSDPFHLARLHLEARRVRLEAYTSPTQTSPISRSLSRELGYMLAEAAKLPVMLIRGFFS
jgi:uncharacterized SAM-binding protein YcdF (DUF218 family)